MKLVHHTHDNEVEGSPTWPTFGDVNDEIEYSARVRKALDHYEHTLASIRDEQHPDNVGVFVACVIVEVYDYVVGEAMMDVVNRNGRVSFVQSVEFAFVIPNPSAYMEFYWHEADGGLNCHV